MQDANVVIVFDSRDESIERLALAAAVGAVQGRAFIRLRRLPGTPETPEYVTPRDADMEWAAAIVLGADKVALPPEAAPYLEKLHESGKLSCMIGKSDSADTAREQGRNAAEAARARRALR